MMVSEVTWQTGTAEPRAGETSEDAPGMYTTHMKTRTEYVLVRMVQAVIQFFRQVRTIVSSGSEPPPEVVGTRDASSPTPVPADDLTQIPGLTAAHAQRLRVAGIRTFAQLTRVSRDELVQLFAAGEPPPNVDQWLVHARRMAATNPQDSVSS